MRTDIQSFSADVVVEEYCGKICLAVDDYDSGYIDLRDIVRWVKENMPLIDNDNFYEAYLLDVQIKTVKENLERTIKLYKGREQQGQIYIDNWLNQLAELEVKVNEKAPKRPVEPQIQILREDRDPNTLRK